MTERIVFIHLAGEMEAVPAGRLRMIESGVTVRASTFAYGRRYLGRRRPAALPVDPVSLPLSAGRNGAELLPVAGLALFGALRDATPDAWGRRVIENRLRAPPNGLPESVYLDHAGPHRVGALDVRESPDSPSRAGVMPTALDLDHLVEAAARIEEGEPVPAHLDILFAAGTSIGGARPKAVLTADGSEWIAKFPSRNDAFDMPRIEQATLELARIAGMNVPSTRRVDLADGRSVLLIERFDRERIAGGTGRRHQVSALTLLGLDEQESPNASYGDIAHVLGTFGVTGCISEDREELFARMIFNILVSNDDDHLRNHAFISDPEGNGWRLSPLFDVLPKPQVGSDRQQHLSVGPQGRASRLDNALAGAGRFGLLPPKAFEIVDRVIGVVRPWREHFERFGVSSRECDRVATAFRRARDLGWRA